MHNYSLKDFRGKMNMKEVLSLNSTRERFCLQEFINKTSIYYLPLTKMRVVQLPPKIKEFISIIEIHNVYNQFLGGIIVFPARLLLFTT